MVRPTITFIIACVAAVARAAPAFAEQAPVMRGHAQKASPAGR
jgi:hypothetical protein